MSVASPSDISPSRPATDSRALLIIGWIVSGIALFMFLGSNPVQRTQEARVAETARQMLGHDARDWLIPRLNGEIRLQKPPLMYWLSAVSYEIGGVSEFTARIPIVIIGWLTIGLTYLLASFLFGRRVGLLAGATLASSYLFFRHLRLAETDGPATLGVTLALYGMMRAIGKNWWHGRLAHAQQDSSMGEAPMLPGTAGSILWFHLAAVGIALAIFSKGMPGLFPCLFLAAWVITEKRWDVPLRVLISGAALTAIVLAVPWYLYVTNQVGWKTLVDELNTVAAGENHGGWFFQYIPQFFLAAAPWSAFLPFAIFEAARRWRIDPRMRAMILWLAAIFLPLCVAGNKQTHYLLPLMPPIMILIGWMIDAGCRATTPASLVRGVKWLMLGTLIGSTLAGIGLLIAARIEQGGITSFDVGIAVAATVVIGAVWLPYRRGVIAAALGLSLAWAGLFPVILSLWFPRFEPSSVRVIASRIDSQFGRGPYCFFGGDRSVPLCFALRSDIRAIGTNRQLLDAVRAEPNLIVISLQKSKTPPTLPPPPFEKVYEFATDEQTFEFYKKVP